LENKKILCIHNRIIIEDAFVIVKHKKYKNIRQQQLYMQLTDFISIMTIN